VTTVEAPTHKRCTKCVTVKPLDDFQKCNAGRAGRRARCRDCLGIKSARPALPPPDREGEARCCRCLESKPVSEFHKAAGRPYGVRSACKLCMRTTPLPETFPEGMKRCTGSCKEVKPYTAFQKSVKHPTGHRSRCRECSAADLALREPTPPMPAKLGNLTMIKVCTKCERMLRVTEFHPHGGCRDGRHSICKGCVSRGRVGRRFEPKPAMIGNLTMIKVCIRCDQMLLVTAFYSSPQHRDGRDPRCIKCVAAFNRSEAGRAILDRSAQKRRARELGLPAGPWSRAQIIERDGPACWLCGIVPDSPHVEHLIPIMADPEKLAAWGVENPGTVLANLGIACGSCNSTKGNRIMPCAIARYLRNLAAEGEDEVA
jgi:hypothetical protein